MKHIMSSKDSFIYAFIYYFSRIGLCILYCIIGPLCWFLSRGKRKACSPVTNRLLLYSAKKLAYMIRTKKIKCEEIIRVYINRAKLVNKTVNAIVEDRFMESLKEAIELDNKIANNFKTIKEMQQETPLLGVPVTVKESIMIKGMSCNAGCFNSKFISNRDADIVQKIKKSGAIIIASTNTPEMCLFWETFNKKTGLTKNPYDTTRTVGGSSGGEAALISSGASVIGLGSDLAGSLRLPAFFTGIYSHKPTSKLTSIDGHRPVVHDKNVDKYLVTGPLARYAEDLPLLMSILVNSDKSLSFLNCNKNRLKHLKVYYMEKECTMPLAKDVDVNIINNIKLFAAYLQGKFDTTVEQVDIKNLRYAFPIAVEKLLSLDNVESVFLDEDLHFNFWPEFLRFITFRSNSTFSMICYGIIKYLHDLLLKPCDSPANNLINSTKRIIEDLLGENGILLYPTFTTQAHYHYSMFYKIMDFSYVAIFNVLGLPVTNCPANFVNGLPTGFQIISKEYNDELTLAVAQEAETFFKGWKSPGSNNINSGKII